MNPPSAQAKRPRWPLAAAILAPPIVVGLIVVFNLVTSGPAPQDMWVGASDYGPTSTASTADVQVIHSALHNIGAQCLETNPNLSTISADVDLILAFAHRYPVGRFPIDDETATASSLLLITREAVKNCAPAELARLEAGE
ncbi:MAG: hypothetical protein ACKVOG_07460 [Rhodoglobus sp.]